MTHKQAFEAWVAHVLFWEGGYANNPNDSGGETNKGVTWATFQSVGPLVLSVPTTRDVFLSLTDDQVKMFMKYYWDRSGAGKIAYAPAAAMVAEIAWGSGAGIAGTSLQRVLNQVFGSGLDEDGSIGPLTIAAANAVPGAQLLAQLISYREWWLNDLVRRRPKDENFIGGWMNRLRSFVEKFKASVSPGTPAAAAGVGVSAVAIVAGMVLLYVLSQNNE